MSSTGWQPNPEGLQQLLQILRNTQNPDGSVQKQIHTALQNFKKVPEYNRYLVYIFANLKDEQEFVRTVAGLILKNNIPASTTPEEQQYLKNEVIKVIGDPIPIVRRTCGSIMTTILGVGSIQGWPGIIPFLVTCLDHKDRNVVIGGFCALEKICEDHTYELDSDQGGRPLNLLLPKFLGCFTHPDPELRYFGISCIIKFIHVRPTPMVANMERFIDGFFYLTNDPEIPIQRRVVAAFILLADVHVAAIKPHLPKVIAYILACMQHPNEDLALEATEFWKILASYDSICNDLVKPFLGQIFPVLLTKMMYSEHDLNELGIIKEDSHIPDRPQDVRPQFTSTPSRGHASKEEHGEDGEDKYDLVSHWNIRKGSAEALDLLSRSFKDGFLPPLLPLFEQGFMNQNWLFRESCILGLGCISSGCFKEMTTFLSGLVPYLFSLLSDEQPLIRSISCWTLGRYSKWIMQQEDKEKFPHRLMKELLARMQDKNKRVQKAATSGIAAVIENANADIEPYTEAILSNFNLAFQTYQRRNLVVLYDAISTLAEALGPDLNKEKYLRLLLPPLLHKWESFADDDTDLFPVLECVSFVAVSLGTGFMPYTKPIFDRCIKLIQNVLVGTVQHTQNPNVELPNREFLICSLDLLSGLCEALKGSIEPLVANSKLVALVAEICKDAGPDYCQSCYALVGDLAKYSMGPLQPALNEILPLLVQGIRPRFLEASNNAVWAIGEIIMKVPPEYLKPHVELIFKHVLQTFNEGHGPMETCAVTIGRLGLFFPTMVAPHLSEIIRPLCIALRNLPDDPEKEDALRGLCSITRVNPQAVLPELQTFCELIVTFYNPNPSLRDLFSSMLHGFKNQIPAEQWHSAFEMFSARVKNTLRQVYHL